MTREELTQWQRANDLPYARELPDGRLVAVCHMAFTFRLVVGDTVGYSQGWDYPSRGLAVCAAVCYDGTGAPLDGWVRHMRAGQPDRRRPDGDPAREYVEGEDRA